MAGRISNDKRFDGIASDCYGCVLSQARTASRLAGLTGEQEERVLSVAEEYLERSKTEPLLVQHIIRYLEDEIISQSGQSPEFDIYGEIKKRSNDLALAYAGECRRKMASCSDPFAAGIQMAAAGNIIDFGAKGRNTIDVEKELQNLTETAFSRYDIDSFRRELSRASLLLYLCDNCGEIVFDMLFIEQLKRIFPDLEIVAALRQRPAINDATLSDAREIGMDRLVRTMSSGSVYPGTVMAETTGEFRELFNTAEVILAKGQGNFETLLPLDDSRLFFLLRIKCRYMAELVGEREGSLVLMRSC